MVISGYSAEDMRRRRTEDMDGGNYTNLSDDSTHNEGIFRGGNANSPAFGGSSGSNMGNSGVLSDHVSSMRVSRGNMRASRGRVRSSRDNHTGLDGSRRSPGDSGIYDRRDTNVVHQSGLEGYGRYLGVPGANESYDSVFNDMDSSEYPEHARNDYQGSHGAEFSLPAHCLDGGLESYGRYLGSSSEPEDCRETVQNGDEIFRLNRESGSRGGLDFFRGVLSDYEGLGSYGQPYIENGDTGFSRDHVTGNIDTFTNSRGYGHRF